MDKEKTWEGLMEFLRKRLTPEEYAAATHRARVQHGLSLQDFVGARIIVLGEARDRSCGGPGAVHE